MKNAIFANWKTTSAAAGLILVAVGHFMTTGAVNPADIMAVIGALGLGAASDAAK